MGRNRKKAGSGAGAVDVAPSPRQTESSASIVSATPTSDFEKTPGVGWQVRIAPNGVETLRRNLPNDERMEVSVEPLGGGRYAINGSYYTPDGGLTQFALDGPNSIDRSTGNDEPNWRIIAERADRWAAQNKRQALPPPTPLPAPGAVGQFGGDYGASIPATLDWQRQIDRTAAELNNVGINSLGEMRGGNGQFFRDIVPTVATTLRLRKLQTLAEKVGRLEQQADRLMRPPIGVPSPRDRYKVFQLRQNIERAKQSYERTLNAPLAAELKEAATRVERTNAKRTQGILRNKEEVIRDLLSED